MDPRVDFAFASQSRVAGQGLGGKALGAMQARYHSTVEHQMYVHAPLNGDGVCPEAAASHMYHEHHPLRRMLTF